MSRMILYIFSDLDNHAFLVLIFKMHSPVYLGSFHLPQLAGAFALEISA